MKNIISCVGIALFLATGVQAVPTDNFDSTPQETQLKRDLEAARQAQAKKRKIQAQERQKASANAEAQLRNKLKKQIKDGEGNLKSHYLDINVKGEEVIERFRVSINPLGEARLIHADLQEELKTLGKRSMLEEGAHVAYGNGKNLEKFIFAEQNERLRLEASLKALRGIVKDNYGSDDLSAKEGRDYKIVEKRRVSRSGPMTP
jgi:hypothetical protein